MKQFTYIFIFISSLCFSQQDTIRLQDIVVSDIRLSKNRTQRVIALDDSIISQNAQSLTDLLRFNSSIFFKENGKGMVSSPSFRGTTAQQTSVLWNGISINSGFLGQSDFNTIAGRSADEIIIKPGGGSFSHGSGAIGGSVHIKHKLTFDRGWQGKLIAGIGEFNTYNTLGKVQYSTDKFSTQLSYNRSSSDNDFEVEEANYKNRNAQYYNHTYNWNTAYKFNPNNTLSLYTELYEDERHFVILEESATRSKYQNNNLRSLLQWDNKLLNYDQTVKVGFFQEEFIYFDRINRDYFSRGKIDKYIAQYDGEYQLKNQMNLSLLGEISKSIAQGENTGIDDERPTNGNMGLKFSHQLLPKFYYEIGVRKEFNKNYESPTLFTIGLSATPIKFLNTKFNISKNFRAPSFNDLYWEPGGNQDLLAETSLQFELIEELNYKNQKVGVSLYLNDIDHLIQWLPSGAGYWEPRNTKEVRTKGFEAYTHLSKNWEKHKLALNTQYAYTLAKDESTDTQLAYVPNHKLNGSVSYSYKYVSAYMQGVIIGDSYTTTDENSNYISEGYNVFNAGINFSMDYQLSFNLGLKVNNIFNQKYEVKPKYFMPKRNFEIQLITNF